MEDERFTSEESCLEYIGRVRWPKRFPCPNQCETIIRTVKEKNIVCVNCDSTIPILTGTIFQGSHIAIKTWLSAIEWFAVQKSNVSAMELKKVFGFGGYKTAYFRLRDLRRFLPHPKGKLGGVLGMEEFKLKVRDSKNKSKRIHVPILLAARISGKQKIIEIRLKMLNPLRNQGEEKQRFLSGEIDSDAHITTQGRKSKLAPLKKMISEIQQRLMTTYRGATDAENLQSYLDEFTFRFNSRRKRKESRFRKVIENIVQARTQEIPA